MNHLFIVGAQRSGSTYLYHLLDDHPSVAMSRPVRPEPKFFLNDELYAKGRAYYEERYFGKQTRETKYLGEKSTSYIESLVVANRIHGFYADARILMILRDPVIRAYSNYRFSVAHHLEDFTFSEALEAEPDRLRNAEFSTSVNPFAYRARGHYINYIDMYLTVFDRGQLEVLIFEELVSNLNRVQDLYRSLGIDHNFAPGSLRTIFNPATRQGEDQADSFRLLANEYQGSVTRLEDLLGRRIDAWRDHWTRL